MICQSNLTYIRCRRASKEMPYGKDSYTSQFSTLIETNIDIFNFL